MFAPDVPAFEEDACGRADGFFGFGRVEAMLGDVFGVSVVPFEVDHLWLPSLPPVALAPVAAPRLATAVAHRPPLPGDFGHGVELFVVAADE